ncbi:hypothetical protein [Nocardia abscessus]|uniref:hypothetical protein n=1 Tax=Nocardia abscessus TaxID=120957 RepID=UPI0005BDE90E|nr:hypothetical protein [Nocardia abscessus]MCC3332256.1 hypothetical protein [Nocardia abscessus]
MSVDGTPKQRFLVCHDYGMGGLWWWVHARSAREIVETFAETWVIEEPQQLADAQGWDLDEVDIDNLADSALYELRAQRLAQRNRTGFGVLADRELLYTRERAEGDDGVPAADYLTEITNGYRTRQVEVRGTGEAVRTGLDDFPLNPPIDLWDPDLAEQQITAEEFEKAWDSAVPAPDDWYS